MATELHRYTISDIPLPSSFTRSTIIRSLSVIVSWFENESHSTNPTHKAGVEINKAITKLLDDTLNHQATSTQHREGAVDVNTAQEVQGHQEYSATGNTHQLAGSYLHGEAVGNESVNDIVFDSSENFLRWLDEFGVDTTVPDLPL